MAKGTRRTARPAREGFAALITVITEEEMLEAAHASLPQESKRRRESGTNERGWSERASAQPGASEAAPPHPQPAQGEKQGPGKRWTRDLRLRRSSRPAPCCHEDLRTPELKSEAVTYTKEFFLPPGVKYLSKDSNRIVPSC